MRTLIKLDFTKPNKQLIHHKPKKEEVTKKTMGKKVRQISHYFLPYPIRKGVEEK